MSEPLVVAIMLVNGREAMVRRAVASFQAQSYERKLLMILDTGTPAVSVIGGLMSHMPMWAGRTIGALRNEAVALAGSCDIICTFDSDDVSNEHRIAEQVALLQASGADCVGYYEAPFWDTRSYLASHINSHDIGGVIRTEALAYPHIFAKAEACLYRDPARKHVLGASMAYWRKAWERHPFDDINHGEDYRFQSRCKTVAVSAIMGPSNLRAKGEWHTPLPDDPLDPRIVCGIHGSNTSPGYDFTKRQQCFRRAPEFDAYCARVMAL